MQEQIDREAVAITVKASKLTARALAKVLVAVGRKIMKEHRKAQTPQGKQSVKKLMNHNVPTDVIPIDGDKGLFDKIARKWHVDYAFHNTGPDKHVLQQEQESIYKAAQRDYTKAASALAELKAEVIKAIRGESKFSSELLNEFIVQAETGLSEIEAVRNTAKQELDGCKYRTLEMQVRYDEVISWTELYDAADLAAKKMIVANLINRVEVGTNYQIHIDFNIDLEHFNIQLDCCS